VWPQPSRWEELDRVRGPGKVGAASIGRPAIFANLFSATTGDRSRATHARSHPNTVALRRILAAKQWAAAKRRALRANFFQVFAPVLRSSATKTNFGAVAGRFFLFGQCGHTLIQLAPARSWGFLLPTTTRPTLSSCECLAEVSKRTGEQFYSQRRSVQSVMAKRNRSVTLVTRQKRESNYAAFSPGAEGEFTCARLPCWPSLSRWS
jgi:hypothetical protein